MEEYNGRQRTGRWTGMERQAASIGSLAWRPYLDHHVVETVRRVPLQLRTDERLIADLLDVLAPELHDIRFAGSRWKFDKHPPTAPGARAAWEARRSEEHTSELQSLMRISYAVFCLNKKNKLLRHQTKKTNDHIISYD